MKLYELLNLIPNGYDIKVSWKSRDFIYKGPIQMYESAPYEECEVCEIRPIKDGLAVDIKEA